MRKQTIKTALAALAALGIMLAAGCSPLTQADTDAPDGGAPGTGRVTIRLAGNGARTLLPAEPAYASYEIAFSGSPEGVPAVAGLTPDRTAMDAGVSLDLPAGTWTITVTGKVQITGVDGITDGQYPAASGSKTGVAVTAGGDVTVEIDLSYDSAEGTGVLTYDIPVPAYTTVATLTVLDLEGAPLDPPVAFNLQTASAGSVNLPSGFYLVKAEAEGPGRDQTVKADILHIYRYMTTEVALTGEFDIISLRVIPAADIPYALTDLVSAPAADAAPSAAPAATEYYTAALTWTPAPPEWGSAKYFDFGTVYTAALTLTPKPGLTFGTVSEFTHTGATAVSRTVNAGTGAVTVTLEFGSTAGSITTRSTATNAGLYIGNASTAKSGITSLSDALALIAANAVQNGKYRYVLSGDITSQDPIVLDTTAFNSKTGVEITLAGASSERTIQLASAGGQLFTVSGGTLRLDANITLKGITNNTPASAAGGVLILVETGGTLIMEANSKIKDNTSTQAGDLAGSGVMVRGEAAFIMEGGEISGNSNNNNGAVRVASVGAGHTTGIPQFTMKGGEIKNNTGNYGCGVSVTNNGVFTMTGGLITLNNYGSYTGGQGGGVYIGGTFNMEGGEISDNTAKTGGGVFVNGGTFNMTDGVIKANTVNGTGGTAGYGGGVNVRPGATFYKTGGTINGVNAGSQPNVITGNPGNRGAAVAVFNHASSGTLLKALENTVDAGHNLSKASDDDTAEELTAENGWDE